MKILITDDHALFRDGLRQVLKLFDNDLQILEAEGCASALSVLGEHPDTDLLLLDMAMPGINGIDALKLIRAQFPGVPIIVVSASEDRRQAQKALNCGASGYIPKSSTSKLMLSALRLVLSGGVYLPPLLLATQANHEDLSTADNGSAPCPMSPLSDTNDGPALTARQLEVLSRLCRGESNKQICKALGVSQGTVKIHITAILKALDVSNRTQAVIKAQALGLITEKIGITQRDR